MESMTVVDPSDLYRIHDIVHDNWFNFEDISYDAQSQIIVIPFRREEREQMKLLKKGVIQSTVEIPIFKWYLRIHNATNIILEDIARVGIYDLNVITYDGSGKRVKVKTNAPTRIEAEVTQLKVTLEETDEMVDSKKRKIFRWLTG